MVDGDDDGERMKKKVHSAMVAKHPSPTGQSAHQANYYPYKCT